MSQEDTYRPAVLPSEAVMMPAMEEATDAPLPAAQDNIPPDDPSMRPAQRSNMSLELEKIRSSARIPRNVAWMNAAAAPLGRSPDRQAAPRQAPQAPLAPQAEAPGNRSATIGQGSALTSLMRSAARQYGPAPSLMPPQPLPGAQRPMPPRQPMEGPQMRGALRQVVRSAQQPQQP